MQYYRLLIRVLPYFLCLAFFIAYSMLAIVRHNHYQSFGYDLGINDQAVWKYSQFHLPSTTIDPFPGKTKLAEHIEVVYAIISPAYWIWSSPIMLILLQNLFVCSSGIAIYLLGKKYKLSILSSTSILIAYLMFYGIQFALWTDVHSSVFAASFIMWFIYFLDTRQHKLCILFFLLALTAKESTGTALFFISLVYFWHRREKILVIYLIISTLYILFAFYIFFPYIMQVPYLYANQKGILSNTNPLSLIDTHEKRITIFYSFASWGFLPILSPLTLLPVLSHFFKFFVLASDLPGAQGLFGHYRISLAPLLGLATIWTLKRFTIHWQTFLSIWLLISVLSTQYVLHLPLSYLTKAWFWHQPSAVKNIDAMISKNLPPTVSVVSQNNITPHLSERDKIFTLYPEKKIFDVDSPCGKKECNWFRWDQKPEFLLIDTSMVWDIRHLLTDRDSFTDGIKNLEKAEVIVKYKQVDTAVLYKIIRSPNNP